MFKKYKPKGDRVDAVQVTEETAEWVAKHFRGRVKTDVINEKYQVRREVIVGVEFPTFEGVKFVRNSEWIIRNLEGEGFKTLTDDEFTESYEPARNTRNGES